MELCCTGINNVRKECTNVRHVCSLRYAGLSSMESSSVQPSLVCNSAQTIKKCISANGKTLTEKPIEEHSYGKTTIDPCYIKRGPSWKRISATCFAKQEGRGLHFSILRKLSLFNTRSYHTCYSHILH